MIVNELLAAIDEDRDIREVSSSADSRATLEMIMAVHESNRLGTRVAFPLANRDNPTPLGSRSSDHRVGATKGFRLASSRMGAAGLSL